MNQRVPVKYDITLHVKNGGSEVILSSLDIPIEFATMSESQCKDAIYEMHKEELGEMLEVTLICL